MQLEHPDWLGPLPVRYRQLLTQLARTGWMAHGTVVCRPLRRKIAGQWVEKGPYYLWTAKRQGKTVCYALAPKQYQAAQQAIRANRRALKLLATLQALTLENILKKIPGVKTRK